MRNNVLIMPVFHQEASRNNAQLCKAQFFIQTQSRFIGADHGIELQNPETEFFAMFHTVFHQNSPIRLPRSLPFTA